MKFSRSAVLLFGLTVATVAVIFVFLPSRFKPITTKPTGKPPRPLSADDKTPRLPLLVEGGARDHGEDQTPETSDVNVPKPASVEDFLRRLVIVTAISDNHFAESQGMLSSVKKCLPKKKTILYDLGLNDKNKRKIKEVYKDIEIRPFPYNDYKHLPHVKNLISYAWKPILIKEVSLKYDIIMYGDSSLRMKSCDIRKPLKHLLNFPLFAALPLNHVAIEFVHDGMIKYLHYPKARKDIAHMLSIEASGWLLWANATMKEKLIEPLLDCALHKECIAPKGTRTSPCHFTRNHDGHFIGCHRYDQAAMDMILAREFGPDVPIRAQNSSLSRSIWTYKRL